MPFYATGELFGWTEAQLLAGLASAQKELAAGSALISVTSGDVAQQRMTQNNARERISMFQRGLYELYLQDSLTYAQYAYFNLAGQNTTRGVFWGVTTDIADAPAVSQGTNYRVKNGVYQVYNETDGLWYSRVAQTVNGVVMEVLSQVGEV